MVGPIQLSGTMAMNKPMHSNTLDSYHILGRSTKPVRCKDNILMGEVI